ncbi:MAG: hypothetical protein HC817_07735 [Saprospiraceae bacterium]|nr:hypothetical protein [Saprospiraceae bacterium]
MERPLDPSTGYDVTEVNAGSIVNKGFEIGITAIPIKLKDFSWDLRANFTKNISLVESLPDDSKEILIDGFSDLGNFAVEGQPFGVIKGNFTERDAQGRLLVTENGDWKASRETGIIGDPNPDFLLTGISNIRYKFLSLGVHLDYVQGGQIFSYTAATFIGRGVSKDLENFSPETLVILPGVKEDGTPNDIPMPASGLFFGNNILSTGAYDRGIYEATRLHLREVSLNIDIPAKWFGQSFFKGGTLSFIGNNLWFRAFNTPKYSYVDASRTAFGTGNGFGFDFLSGPSARRYGANIRLNF